MTPDDAKAYVEELYTHLLRRTPAAGELGRWAQALMDGATPQSLFRSFVASPEFVRKREVSTLFPPGHYHSPVVDPSTIKAYYARSRAVTLDQLAGIEVDVGRMLDFWNQSLPLIQTTPFREEKTADHRFHYEGGPYPWGDAIMLRAMLSHYRPSRVVEIGSGFSTACMLDTADERQLGTLRITCIEPFPDRLHSLMRPPDFDRVTIIPKGVQEVELGIFDQLGPGDILFIDSTHVLKTGSDVHYELFDILPRLQAGVLVHVHDCPFPFEYPEKWVFDLNYSWNEVYVLRAFLMYNKRFSIVFWNSLLASLYRPKVLADYPPFLRNPGSSIWLIVNH